MPAARWLPATAARFAIIRRCEAGPWSSTLAQASQSRSMAAYGTSAASRIPAISSTALVLPVPYTPVISTAAWMRSLAMAAC